MHNNTINSIGAKTPTELYASVAQLDRASDSDSEGRRFDSCQAHHVFKPFEAIQAVYFFLAKVRFLAFFLQIDTIIARNYPDIPNVLHNVLSSKRVFALSKWEYVSAVMLKFA